ncbi:MAG: hypothetical protein WA269_01155 [Candidatus Udaeobacter sp.]
MRHRAAVATTGRQNLKSSHFDPSRWQSLAPKVTVETSEADRGLICSGRKYVWQQQATDALPAFNWARCQYL